MTAKNLIFIDSRVAGYQTLPASLGADTEWHLLNAEQDGVAQMQRLLAGRSGLDSIQVVSHGAAGTLYLGSTVLNSGNLGSHQTQLQAIGSSLSATGNLLLYGCDVAQGEAGLRFIDSLASLTGADVAASDDLTGSGGDGLLEQATGDIEAKALELAGLATSLAGHSGIVTTDFGVHEDRGQSVTVQADGKILVAGYSGYYGSSDFAVVRYNSNGTLDASFSGDGMLTTDFGSYDFGQSVTVQADGKILVAGYSNNIPVEGESYNNIGDFSLVRYNTDGSLDTRFSGDSRLTTNIGSIYDVGNSVTIQADGKILVAGYSSNGSSSDFSLVRYNTDGSLDTSFSGDGMLTTDLGSSDFGQSVTVQADGKILVAGSSGSDFALVRYHTDGTLDTAFGSEVINGEPTGTVIISGNAIQGETLTVANNLADADGLGVISYQWKANGTAIAGATGSSLVLGQAQVGKTISVSASYTDPFGTAEGVSSAATSAVANINDTPTGAVTLSGTALEGQRLQLVSTLQDPDGNGTARFQWLRDNVAITGATASSYTLAASDVGKSIAARLSYTDGGGFAESRTSAAVRPTGLNPGVTISGTDRTTGEAGDTAVFSVKLDKAPVDPVTIQFAISDATEGRLSVSSLSFTKTNWNVAQTLTVTGVDDFDNDGHIAYNLTASIATNDLSYKRVTISPIALSNQDDGLDAPILRYGTDAEIDYLRGNNGADRLYGRGNMDDLRGGRGDDRLYGDEDDDRLYGEDGNDELYGGYDDDQLSGGNGNDALYGEAGADRLEGGAGNDTLDGGTGADTMIGGAGNDTYLVDNANDVVNDQGLATDEDTVLVLATIRYQLAANVEKAEIRDSSGAASLTGNALANDLKGNASQNTLDGGAGNDLLDAGAGNDTVLGGTGTDTLAGGAGSDRLDGGAGADNLYGGAADQVADVFDFNATTESTRAARDKVYDFVTRIDKIDLAGIDANTATTSTATGNQAFTFNTTTAKANAIWYKVAEVDGNASTRDIILYGDVNGNTTADFEIGLVGVGSLVAGDFVL